jgi:hypothetical protein
MDTLIGVPLLLVIFIGLPITSLAFLWWLIKGARRSGVKRGILVAIVTWSMISAWNLYQWDRHHTVLACIVEQKDAEHAKRVWQENGISVELYCMPHYAGRLSDCCQAFIPNYQVNKARQLVPEGYDLSE